MKLVKEKGFYRGILAIAVPIFLQNLITFSTSRMDTLMLGKADDTRVLLSAPSLANLPFFLSMVCVFFCLCGNGSVGPGVGDGALLRLAENHKKRQRISADHRMGPPIPGPCGVCAGADEIG